MNKIIVDEENLKSMIYEVREKQVMLDSDLAKLYHVETKRINEAVKNNLYKFPIEFSWKLTKEEYSNLRSKFSTSNLKEHGGRRYSPRVFTEQGVAMLATILKSKIAIEISVKIIDAFVIMRHNLQDNKEIYKSLNIINNKLFEYEEKLNYLFSRFDKKEYLFLPGENYDAYSIIKEILNETKNELIIIDSYADKTVLDFIKDIDVHIILITSKKASLSDLEIKTFNKQYNKLKVFYNNKLHDRYFILDKTEIFHVGTSLNHAGKKLFSINKLEDKFIKNNLMNFIYTIIRK